jgi:hypothetical protein
MLTGCEKDIIKAIKLLTTYRPHESKNRRRHLLRLLEEFGRIMQYSSTNGGYHKSAMTIEAHTRNFRSSLKFPLNG